MLTGAPTWLAATAPYPSRLRMAAGGSDSGAGRGWG